MPIYEYRCEKGHTFEVMQRMTEDALTTCESCSASVQRVFHPVAVHFKGSGFYATDYGKKKGSASSEAGSSASSSDSPDKGDSKKGESKKGESTPAPASSSSSKDD